MHNQTHLAKVLEPTRCSRHGQYALTDGRMLCPHSKPSCPRVDTYPQVFLPTCATPIINSAMSQSNSVAMSADESPSKQSMLQSNSVSCQQVSRHLNKNLLSKSLPTHQILMHSILVACQLLGTPISVHHPLLYPILMFSSIMVHSRGHCQVRMQHGSSHGANPHYHATNMSRADMLGTLP